jgi:hypothetical protein
VSAHRGERIYLIREDGSDWAKVGHARTYGRMSELQTGNARQLIWMWSYPGSREDEKAMHRLLARHYQRGRGEWFRIPDRHLVNPDWWRRAVRAAVGRLDDAARGACAVGGVCWGEIDSARRAAWVAAGRIISGTEQFGNFCFEPACIKPMHLQTVSAACGPPEKALSVTELQHLRRTTAYGRLADPPPQTPDVIRAR